MAGNMKGMVIEEGEKVLGLIKDWAGKVQEVMQAVKAIIQALQASWHGPDSQAAIEVFQEILQQLQKLNDLLEEKHQQLDKNIKEQETTSSH